MKIIIEHKEGVDYPSSIRKNEDIYKKFIEQLKRVVKERLELREIDEIIIRDKIEIEKIKQRLDKILEGTRGIKKALNGQYCYGFLVALLDYGIISEEEYKEIRGFLVGKYGYFA